MTQQNRFYFYAKVIMVIVLFAMADLVALANGDASQEIKSDYYYIEDGKVDAETFLGYNVFHSVCVGCHGVGGAGTDMAPDLYRAWSD